MDPVNLKICLVQSDIIWEDKKKNFEQYDIALDSQKGVSDLIVLPEMFATGFTMNAQKLAENEHGGTIAWMHEKAVKYNSVITGSMIFESGNDIFNRLIWMKPCGSWEYYDKRHLFTMAGEKEHYSAGNTRRTFLLKGWKIMPMICYDLRFPVWFRNTEEYDLMVNVACWPESRRLAWDTLIKARALENQSYVCGVNRTGIDGNIIKYNGGSVIIGPDGKTILSFADNVTGVKTGEISMTELREFRKNFPVLKDMDKFSISS